MSITTIPITGSENYDVLVGNGLLASLAERSRSPPARASAVSA